VATVVCGDNFFAEHETEALTQILTLMQNRRPDLLIAGPAFSSGRYGIACVSVCQKVSQQLGIPAITGLSPENPGVDVERSRVYIFPTGSNVKDMGTALSRMAAFAGKLSRGEIVGSSSDEGYLPRGFRRNVVLEETAAQRALTKLLSKLRGEPYQTEVPLPKAKEPLAAAPPVDPAKVVIALVTEGGLVPLGNPDRLESAVATKWFKYPLIGFDRLPAGQHEAVHGGYFAGYVNADPNRLVPVDVMREFERSGAIGKLFDYYYVTTGMITPVKNCERMGEEMAKDMQKNGVQAAIITST
jgi:glycine reductase